MSTVLKLPKLQGCGAGAIYMVKLEWGFTWERGEYRQMRGTWEGPHFFEGNLEFSELSTSRPRFGNMPSTGLYW